jgi:hypothetical protein
MVLSFPGSFAAGSRRRTMDSGRITACMRNSRERNSTKYSSGMSPARQKVRYTNRKKMKSVSGSSHLPRRLTAWFLRARMPSSRSVAPLAAITAPQASGPQGPASRNRKKKASPMAKRESDSMLGRWRVAGRVLMPCEL